MICVYKKVGSILYMYGEHNERHYFTPGQPLAPYNAFADLVELKHVGFSFATRWYSSR